MKKLIILLCLLFISPVTVSAHLAGQPPFFKINGTYANLYPVPLTSLSDFNLPQDGPPENYLVNQTLNFELDGDKLPAPKEIVSKTKFTWDFGDGTGGTGLKTDHKYTKMGSYIIDIYADDGTTPTPQILEKVLVNILPDSDYHLPKAVIVVDGKQSKDPLTDILQVSFNSPVSFNAVTSGDSPVVSYFWDFGDQNSDTKVQTSHEYQKDLTQVFPVLRIKDSNGFIADSFVEVQNSDLIEQTALTGLGKNSATSSASSAPSQLKTSILVIGGLVGVVLILRALFRI